MPFWLKTVDLWTVGPSKFHSFRSRFSPLRLSVMSSFAPAAAVDDVLASSLETVESLAVPRDEGDSDQDWEKLQDDVAVARATLAHNLAAHVDETVNSTLTSFTAVEVDDTTLSERLQEMDAAMARLMMKGDEQVVVTEQTDVVMEDQTAAANSTVPAAGDLVPEARQIGHSGDTPDDAMGVGYPTTSSTRAFSSLPSGTLEEKLYHIEGFLPNFPGIGERSADLVQQFTQVELGELFSKLKTESWSRASVERVLEVYQIYKRQLAQEKLLAAPFSRDRRGVPMALRLSLAHTVASQPFDEVTFADERSGEMCHLPFQETLLIGLGYPALKAWTKDLLLSELHFDLCHFGFVASRPTRAVTNFPIRDWNGKMCVHSELGVIQDLAGTRRPEAMLQAIAASLVRTLPRLATVQPETAMHGAPTDQLVPFWDWSVLAGRLKGQQHPGPEGAAVHPSLPSLGGQRLEAGFRGVGASDASASDDGNAYVGGWLSNVDSPSKSEVFWFHYQITAENHPWAFNKGCPKKRIAALEMFGTLILAHFLMDKAPAFIPNLRLPLVSDNQGNVYSFPHGQGARFHPEPQAPFG
eukprot:s2883_g10.t2